MYDETQAPNGRPQNPHYPYPQYPASGIQPSNLSSYSLIKPEINPLDRLMGQPQYSIDPSYQHQYGQRIGYGQVNPYEGYQNPSPKSFMPGPDPYMGKFSRTTYNE